MVKLPEREGIMLCYPISERRIAKFGQDVYCVQPKLNGDRARVVWFEKLPYLISSYGIEIRQVQHINDAIRTQVPDGVKLDGELYFHGMRLEDIHSIVSRKVNKHNDASVIQFHVFDVQDESLTQVERCAVIRGLNLKPPLFAVPTDSVRGTMDKLSDAMVHWVNEGYEGAIIRTWNNYYVMKRSIEVMKWKPKEEDAYRILDTKEGEGWAKGMLGAFLVAGDDGTPFYVGTGALLTKAERLRLWKFKDSLPGKLLLVRHEPMATKKGIPRCATAHKLIEDTTFQATIIG